MHDIKFIRQSPDDFNAAMQKRGLAQNAQEILDLDEKYRSSSTQLQQLQAQRNDISQEIGNIKKQGGNADDKIAQMSDIKNNITQCEADAQQYQDNLKAILESLPNIPQNDVPSGENEDDNIEIRRWGDIPKFDFTPKRHFDLAPSLEMMDFEMAAKISGARFVILRKDLARLERAIANFMLDTHINEHNLEETTTPALVRTESVYGTGQLPKFKEDIYHTDGDFWLIPTSEVPLTCQASDHIYSLSDLPKRYTAWTPCFRSEAGAAGKDTRGLIRQHQFSKVEMVTITHPDHSNDELERMTGCAENILQKLNLPYRVVVLCSGDMGFSAQKTYDIEVWLPGENTYREISSCSNCGSFQARRMNGRFRDASQKGTEFVHTLNGSGLAVGRTMVAILENYQMENGDVHIPEPLIPYMGGSDMITAHQHH